MSKQHEANKQPTVRVQNFILAINACKKAMLDNPGKINMQLEGPQRSEWAAGPAGPKI